MKSKTIKKFLDDFTEKQFGKSRTKCEKQDICVFCHSKIDMEDFRDDLSRKEYYISGLCNKCQEDMFNE